MKIKRTYNEDSLFDAVRELGEIKFDLLKKANAFAVLGMDKLATDLINTAHDIHVCVDNINRGTTAMIKGHDITVDIEIDEGRFDPAHADTRYG